MSSTMALRDTDTRASGALPAVAGSDPDHTVYQAPLCRLVRQTPQLGGACSCGEVSALTTDQAAWSVFR